MANLTNDDVKKVAAELKVEIKRIKDALEKMESDVCSLEAGDDNGPYWNGSTAYSVIKNCLVQLDQDRALLKNLVKCSDYLDSLIS